MTSHLSDLEFNYDPQSDVMYFSIGKPRPAITEPIDEEDDDILVRFDMTSNEVCGLTVLGYSHIDKSYLLKVLQDNYPELVDPITIAIAS